MIQHSSNSIPRDQRYVRTVVTPGRSYTCGCDYRGEYTVLVPQPGKVHHLTCRTHGSPVAR